MEVFTERLVLRPFTKADRDDVHLYASDPAVCFFTDWGPNSEAETDEFIQVVTGWRLNDGHRQIAISRGQVLNLRPEDVTYEQCDAEQTKGER